MILPRIDRNLTQPRSANRNSCVLHRRLLSSQGVAAMATVEGFPTTGYLELLRDPVDDSQEGIE